MKTFYSLFFIALGIFLNAQNTQEFQVNFSSESLESESYEITDFSNWDFVTISAYILKENVESEMSFRYSKNEEWSEWKTLEKFHEGMTNGRTTFQAEPINETFDKIQFKSAKSEAEPFTFRLFFGGAEKKSPHEKNHNLSKSDYQIASLGTSTDSANCSCPQPTVCQRLCWCPSGNCPTDSTPTPTVPTHLIIHHSAGGNSITNFPALVQSYYDFHTNTNGWDDIGYNWLIDPNGVIYEGRGERRQGAHFSCMNEETVGICIIGNYVDTFPTDTSIQSLQQLLAWISCRENIDPAGSSYHVSSQLNLFNISAHLDGNASTAPHHCSATICPGDSLYLLVPAIRTAVENLACLGDVSLKEIDYQEITVFPNPVPKTLSIEIPQFSQGKSARIQIFSASGKLLLDNIFLSEKDGKIQIPVSKFPEGLFIGKLKLNDEIFSFRFSVSK